MDQKKNHPNKPDLTEYEEEDVPLDEVLRRLIEAKPEPKPVEPNRNHEKET